MFQPPTFGSSASGYRNFAYNPTPGTEANKLALADFAPNYDAAINPFVQAFGPGSTFVRWLMGSGRNLISDMYEANRQREIAMGFQPFDAKTASAGDIGGSWGSLLQGDPNAAATYGVGTPKKTMTSAMDFMKGLNLYDMFSGQGQGARGEDQAAFSPFVRFFSR